MIRLERRWAERLTSRQSTEPFNGYSLYMHVSLAQCMARS